MATTPVIAFVASRDPATKKKKGKGFSLAELGEAKISPRLARLMRIPVDFRRGTSYPQNVDLLKTLQRPEIKKEPKKSRDEKVKVPKKRERSSETMQTPTTTPASPAKLADLEKLPGITPELVKKLVDLGVDSPAKLMAENPKELNKLLGTDIKLVKSWIDFAKATLK